jgi:hypothetical protein
VKEILKITSFLFICFFVTTNYAQDKSSHEIGLIYGSASFTTDYGQRNNFLSNVGGNVGMGIGVVYYLNFHDYRYRWYHRTSYFTEHFRVRAELSYMSAKLDHFGKWKDATKSNGDLTDGAKKLRAHHGKTYLLNVGAQLEYHWVDIVDFGSRRIPDLKWSPYISAGAFVDFYDPSMYSELGDWKDPGVLYPKWDINDYPWAARVSPGITMSATLGVGTRRKLGEYSDLLIESRWQYFFSNYVDGLHAKQAPENKYNDWLLWIHVGYVYYLN